MEDVRGVVDRMAGTVDHLRVFSRDVSEEPRQAMDVNELKRGNSRSTGFCIVFEVSQGAQVRADPKSMIFSGWATATIRRMMSSKVDWSSIVLPFVCLRHV